MMPSNKVTLEHGHRCLGKFTMENNSLESNRVSGVAHIQTSPAIERIGDSTSRQNCPPRDHFQAGSSKQHLKMTNNTKKNSNFKRYFKNDTAR